ncbi:MAG: ABC transporter permease [Acidobacteria bacterium]|nr:ABC transporter permease [Acidobacteriota bacterium]
MWAKASWEVFTQDVRYGLRVLAKSPGFSLVAILTLALGIGANTAVFSVVNGVLLNPLAFPHPDRLVVMFTEMPSFKNASISYPNFEDWRRMNRTFSTMAAYRESGFDLTGHGEPERVTGEMVSAGFFEVLGVNPILGRTFSADEDRLGANPTAMISEGLWKRKYGSDPNIIGQRMDLNGTGRTIIGVVPSSFHLHIQNFQRGGPANEVYLPMGEFNEPFFHNNRSAGWGMDAIGRMRDGITFQQAKEDMDRVSRELASAYPDINGGKKARLVPLSEEMVGRVRPVLLVLLGAVFFVLLISCANVANLLLARSTARQREFAIRVAVGAGESRIVRQLLTESILLALIGGALGQLLAKFGTAAAIAAMPVNMPRADDIGLDTRVLLFTLCTSILAGIAFGLAPAIKTSRANVGATLKEAGRSVSGMRSRTQAVLVVGEMAMALVLLTGAGLMIRTLFALWGLDPGFNPHNVLEFSVSGPPSYKSSPDAVRAAHRELHDKLASLPGVESVTLSWGARPLQGDNEDYFWIVGRPMPALNQLPMTVEYDVGSDYSKTMQVPLKRGRFFSESDDERTPAVAVIDEAFAKKYFPNEDPIGHYIDLNTDPQAQEKVRNPQIVGVVGHVNQWGLESDASFPLQAQMYIPISQAPDSALKRGGFSPDVYVRTARAGVPTFDEMRRRALEMNGELVVYAARSEDDVLATDMGQQRFSMILLAVFAGVALLLAVIGIYGVLSYVVGQRTQEIGVRMALGAQRTNVLAMVLGGGARLTLIGIGLGVVSALALTRLMASMLFGVKPSDPLTFGAVALILAAIAAFACLLPAHRATRVDPIVALRYE